MFPRWAFVGGMSGIIIGSLIILLQKNFRFIKVPGTDLAYPVVLEAENFIVVFLTLVFFGSIASFLTVNNIRFVDKSFES